MPTHPRELNPVVFYDEGLPAEADFRPRRVEEAAEAPSAPKDESVTTPATALVAVDSQPSSPSQTIPPIPTKPSALPVPPALADEDEKSISGDFSGLI